MMLTTFDFLALGTILVCLILSAMRGLVREIFDFFGWMIALVVARQLAVPIAETFLSSMQPQAFAVVCGFAAVYFACRIGLVVLNQVLDFTLTKTKLTSVNRLLGAILGGAKGLLLVSIAVLVCSFSSLPQSPEWQNAMTAPFFEEIASLGIPYLPEFLQKQINLPHLNHSMPQSVALPLFLDTNLSSSE